MGWFDPQEEEDEIDWLLFIVLSLGTVLVFYSMKMELDYRRCKDACYPYYVRTKVGQPCECSLLVNPSFKE